MVQNLEDVQVSGTAPPTKSCWATQAEPGLALPAQDAVEFTSVGEAQKKEQVAPLPGSMPGCDCAPPKLPASNKFRVMLPSLSSGRNSPPPPPRAAPPSLGASADAVWREDLPDAPLKSRNSSTSRQGGSDSPTRKQPAIVGRTESLQHRRPALPLGIVVHDREGGSDSPTRKQPAMMGRTESFQHRRDKAQLIRVADFFKEYSLGDEVMPSVHKGMQILHAMHKKSGIEVVVKVRAKKVSFRKQGEEREWRQNTEFMLSLPACAHIAKIYEVLENEDAYYVVMEKVIGQDLFESISGQMLLPALEVKEIVAHILLGLVKLHSRGVIHKDIKLENVMLTRPPPLHIDTWSSNYSLGMVAMSSNTSKDGLSEEVLEPTSPRSPLKVKLIDFDTIEDWTEHSPKRTKDVMGTDQYISQEAYAGNYSPASDIFAVGVIAYRLCTGKFPYNNKIFDDKPGDNWVGSPKMAEIRGKVMNSRINWDFPTFEKDPLMCKLVQAMLSNEERERPSAKDALLHPWLRDSLAVAEFRLTPSGMVIFIPTSPTPSQTSTHLSSRSTSSSFSGSPTRKQTIFRKAGQNRLHLPSCVAPRTASFSG